MTGSSKKQKSKKPATVKVQSDKDEIVDRIIKRDRKALEELSKL